MNRRQIFEIVCDCVSAVLQCNVEEIDESCGLLTTFGWDSLAQVEIFTAIENVFALSFSAQLIEKLTTVKDYVDYIDQIFSCSRQQ